MKKAKLSLIAPLAIFVIMTAMFFYALQSMEPSKLPSVLIGKPAPEFALPAIEGYESKGFSKADLIGGDISIVNVWASWCIPCHEEHPFLVQLAKQSGAPIYGLNYKDTASNAKRFLGKYGDPYKAVGADLKGRTAIDWGVYGVPETFIVNGKGEIVFKHVGPINPDVISSKLIPVIQKVRDARK